MSGARTQLRRRDGPIPTPPRARAAGAFRTALPLSPWAALVAGPIALTLVGCQTAPRPIFPERSPPLVWPAPPDPPRIRYLGELRGEESLGIVAHGWPALEELLAGPRPKVMFSRPVAVAVHGERVYVADLGLGVVHLLDLEKRRYSLLRGSPTDPLRVPIDLAIGGEDTLVVVDRGRAALDIFSLDGHWRTTRHWPELAAPVAIAWDAANQWYWVADAAAHACFATDLRSVRGRVGEQGHAPGKFNFPTALTWRANLGLVIADAMNFRVQLLDATLAPAAVIGKQGDAAGDFALPRGVATDSENHIYVVDNRFENIQIFDRTGQLLLAFGEGGSAPGQFSLPAGITIDARDRIWVADSYNRRVQVFQYLAEQASCEG